MKLILLCPVLAWAIWAVICLIVVFYMIFKAYGIRDLHSDDCSALIRLFFQLLFMPIWMPIKHFTQKRESRKIHEYVDGIRNKTAKTENNQTAQEKEKTNAMP